MITDMNQLEQREYQDYINTVSNSGTNSPEGRDKAFLMFSKLMNMPSIYENYRSQPNAPLPNEEAALVQDFLNSLYVNGKKLFSPPVDQTNYRERLTDAMARISVDMVDFHSTKVPYIQHTDGHCSAIFPVSTPQSTTIPQKPAWYKQLFKRFNSSWNQEVNEYNEAVRNTAQAEKLHQETSEFADKLIERARKRELQTAALEARHGKDIFDQHIKDVFNKTPNEVHTLYIKPADHILKNIGRENVPAGFAIGMMMAEENMTFDQAISPEMAGKRREYGQRFDRFFKRMGEIHRLPDDTPELTAEKVRQFKTDIAPVFADVIASYASESIYPVDGNNPDSILKAGQRNTLLTSYCQGLVQMFRNTMSMKDPLRVQYAAATGEVIRERAAGLDGNQHLTSHEKALSELAKASLPDSAGADSCLETIRAYCPSVLEIYSEPQKMENLKKTMNVYAYAATALDVCTRSNTLTNTNFQHTLFNSAIEGNLMKNEDEIMFGNATLMLSLTEYQGLKNMPEPIKTQFRQPFCVNAYVKTQAYNLYQARFSSVSMDNMTSETLSRHIDCVEKGIPSPGQEDAFKNSDKQEELRKLNEFNLRQSRQPVSFNELNARQASQQGRSASPSHVHTRQQQKGHSSVPDQLHRNVPSR